MTKVYVIMEIGYEYNDEYYSKSDDNAGHPYKTVYTNETEARAKLKELTVDWLKNNHDIINDTFRQYQYDYQQFLLELCTSNVITKKACTASTKMYELEDEDGYREPSTFICTLLDKVSDANLAFQLDILLNELEKYDIIGYSLVTLELA